MTYKEMEDKGLEIMARTLSLFGMMALAIGLPFVVIVVVIGVSRACLAS